MTSLILKSGRHRCNYPMTDYAEAKLSGFNSSTPYSLRRGLVLSAVRRRAAAYAANLMNIISKLIFDKNLLHV